MFTVAEYSVGRQQENGDSSIKKVQNILFLPHVLTVRLYNLIFCFALIRNSQCLRVSATDPPPPDKQRHEGFTHSQDSSHLSNHNSKPAAPHATVGTRSLPFPSSCRGATDTTRDCQVIFCFTATSLRLFSYPGSRVAFNPQNKIVTGGNVTYSCGIRC